MRTFTPLSEKLPEDKELVVVKLVDGDVVLTQCLHCMKTDNNPMGMIFWNDAWREAYAPKRIIGYSKD